MKRHMPIYGLIGGLLIPELNGLNTTSWSSNILEIYGGLIAG